MSIFERLNKKISDNLYRHGHYLTNPHAADAEKIHEMVDDLMGFVREDKRELVRAELIKLLRRYRHKDVQIDADIGDKE